jgi:hypothetical protein
MLQHQQKNPPTSSPASAQHWATMQPNSATSPTLPTQKRTTMTTYLAAEEAEQDKQTATPSAAKKWT